MIRFNPKQRELIRRLKADELARINILEGAVRSGKTWISLIVFALWVATKPRDATFLMVARTLTTLKRNCLELLQSLVGEDNFTYNLSQKQAKLFGRTVYLEGVNDARAEGKIRGMTLTGAYCDELTLFTEEFFSMLLSRLSMPGAKLFASTNPDSPLHWLNVKYLKRANELDMLVVKFTILYKRFILGLWVVADGACYPRYADKPQDYIVDELPDSAGFISIGVDFGGNRSLTTFVATAVHGNYDRLTVVKDHHIAGQKGDIDGDRVNREFIQFVNELRADYNIPVKYVFADSEAQYLINGMRRAASSLGISIGDSQKVEVVQRIICTNSLMNTGRFKVLRRCQLVQDGLMGAVWNPKAAAQGRDERLDDFTSDIDILDALEYSFERFIPRLTPKR